MNQKHLSVNRICLLFSLLLLAAAAGLSVCLYVLTKSPSAVWCALFFCLFVFLCAAFFVFAIRRRLVLFSDTLCSALDEMMSQTAEPLQTPDEESLFYKISSRLKRLYEVSIAKERADLQELISDLSHQVKTPLANLKAINATLSEQTVPPKKQREFLKAQETQLDKLDFLMQAMIKTSRLETGVISPAQKLQPVYDTLAAALGGILLSAEKKQIRVLADCPEQLSALHDRKWTAEALFNILDNAVKYTPAGGSIRVSAQGLELYVRIDIADTGIGICEAHQGAIFKRFYREASVHDTEGVGVGLYLARKIVTMQGGYIRVSSEPEKGSVFSVFLPC